MTLNEKLEVFKYNDESVEIVRYTEKGFKDLFLDGKLIQNNPTDSIEQILQFLQNKKD